MAQRASPGMSDEAVKAKTSRTWAAWVKTLDAAGARTLSHHDIAKMVARKFKLGGWWSQMVTVGYERITGRRAVHQVTDGFNASVSRTLPVSARAAYAVLADPKRRRAILGRNVTFTTDRPGKVVRFAWPKGRVFINFTAKGRTKCQIAIQHEKLPSAAAVRRAKTAWAAAAQRWLKSIT